MTSPIEALGALLNRTEATALAAQFADGQSLGSALYVVASARRAEVRAALVAADVVPSRGEIAVAVLQAIAGAHTRVTNMTPIWTTPDIGPAYGGVTTSIRDLVLAARVSVVCSTFNFQRSSGLWSALEEVCNRGYVDVRLYMDPKAANNPTPHQVAQQLHGAKVFVTTPNERGPVRNHAKFICVDHGIVVVTSANFSLSAEERNIELGVMIESAPLAERIEHQVRVWEGSRYLSVPRQPPP